MTPDPVRDAAPHPVPAPATPVPDPATPASRLPPAGTWRRFMGAVYEGVILFGVLVFFGYGFSALTQFRGESGLLRWAFQAFLFLVVGAYFVWSWSHGRRTLPMKAVSLQLVGRDHAAVTTARAALRYLVAWTMLVAPIAAASTWSGWFALLLPVPFFWSLFDRERRALYDVASGTLLVVKETPPAQRRTQSTK
jgi:uncharacterized RDD family membrane protein YckC